MALKLITPPDHYPVTLEEAKAHLAVDSNDHDDMITAFIAAATDHVDGKYGSLGKAILPQIWELTYDDFPCDGSPIEIPLPPLIEITSIKYDDADGVEQTLEQGTDYHVDTKSVPGWVVLPEGGSWPDTLEAINAVRIEFIAGHQSAASGGDGVPSSIRQAILLIVGDWYKNREDRALINGAHVNIPTAAKALLDQHRIPAFA